MENYKKLYDVSDKKRKKINYSFLTQNIKYLSEYKIILNKYNNSFVKIINCNSNSIYNSKTYKIIKESIDIINECTDYMVGKDMYQLIEIYDLLYVMRKLGNENLDIYKEFIENYLKQYGKALEESCKNVITNYLIKGKMEIYQNKEIMVEYDAVRLEINHKSIKLIKNDILKI